MTSKRKTGPTHAARKRCRRRRNDAWLFRLARRLGLPFGAGDLEGLSSQEIRRAAHAYRRMRPTSTFGELLQNPAVRSLIQDNTLTRAFHDALMPRLIFRGETTVETT